MQDLKLFPTYEEGFFVERDNRFVMRLKKKNGEVVKAHIGNPGRMEEFLVPGHPFFMTSGNKGKYEYRVVSTVYQDSFVLLDTIKINYAVEQLIKSNGIDEFQHAAQVKREVTVDQVEKSKFDFRLDFDDRPPVLLEVKSCSLCHNGVAMFPDAPTTRGKRHLEDLDRLASEGFDTYMLYFINHKGAQVFLPNGHTDPDYCGAFTNAKKLKCLAYAANLIDPVTLDMSDFRPVSIDYENASNLCADRGGYVLVLENPETFSTSIGSLGTREFKKGFYVYAGSAMKGLENRIKRHGKRSKKKHWHMDYISPFHMKIVKTFPIRHAKNVEQTAAERLLKIAPGYIPGFGSTDSKAPSHLFYFPERPHRNREFIDTILDLRMDF